MKLSTAIEHCKDIGTGQPTIFYTQLAGWLQELKTRRALGAAAICDLEFPLLQENEIERDRFITKYVERDAYSMGGKQ